MKKNQFPALSNLMNHNVKKCSVLKLRCLIVIHFHIPNEIGASQLYWSAELLQFLKSFWNFGHLVASKSLTYYNPFTFSKALCLTLYQQHFMHRQVASINTLNIANVSRLSLPGPTMGWDNFKGKLVFCLENCSDLLREKKMF